MSDFSRWPNLAAALAGFGRPAVIVDLETTGGHLYRDRITEIAWLRFEAGEVTHYSQLVNPRSTIPDFVSRLTGISNGMVASAPDFAALAPALLPQLRGCLLLAHNSRFDYTFLRHEFSRCGLHFATPSLCTVQLSRRLFPHFFKHSLDSIIERHQIAASGRHRALSDVLALADYLELAIRQSGEGNWLRQADGLIRPSLPPAGLPMPLAGQINELSDGCGVLLWLDKNNRPLHLGAYKNTFGEAVRALHGNPALRQAAGIRFLPAAGELHAIRLKAQLAAEYAFEPPENGGGYLTVRFLPDGRNRLQAKITPLREGVCSRPYGLFLHKKAAKRALGLWAKEQHFCPAGLDILPSTYAAHAPCPVAVCGGCDGRCPPSENEADHNRITRAARLLPVADWGRAHEIEITETDALSGQSHTFRCAAGALSLPDGSWYFDNGLPAVLKGKFKSAREHIRILA
ncbi:MAG: exonuclease domain-containing protein [Neisseria sp.]|nr:exonuclease domain-containing protein [Neisseria sp.]